MTDSDKSEISKDPIIELAYELKRRHLNLPVLLLIELHRPLAGIAEALTEIMSPFLGLFVGKDKLGLLKSILADSEKLERFLQALSDDAS